MTQSTESVDYDILKAVTILAHEPPVVSHVIRLTDEEKHQRQSDYFRAYYARNKEKIAERFRKNGANRRYYERNRAMKIDMVQTNQFVKRLEAENVSLNPV